MSDHTKYGPQITRHIWKPFTQSTPVAVVVVAAVGKVVVVTAVKF